MLLKLLPFALIALLVGRRVYRSIGFQPYRPIGMWIRAGLLSFIGLAVLVGGVITGWAWALDLLGYGAGVGLAFLAARWLVLEQRADKLFYRTNIWIELAVLSLFLFRLAWRLVPIALSTAAEPDANPWANLGKGPRDPWTAALFCVVAAYYVAFAILLYLRAQAVPKVSPAPP